MSNYTNSFYDETNTNHSWYKAYKFIQDNSKVLDIGCSSGNFGEVLVKKKKCVVDGVESDEGDVIRASKKLRKVYKLNVETDSLNKLTEKYDYIYFGDVIEHLFYPIETLTKVKTLLKPGGAVVFSIPNMGHISVRLELIKGNFEYTETGLLDKTHIHFYTLDEVERVLNAAGYKVEELDFVTKDYPKKLLDKLLNESGLEPTSRFYDLAASPAASAFQFIGLAKPMPKAKIKKLKAYGPIDHFEKFYSDTLKAHSIELERRGNGLKVLKKAKSNKSPQALIHRVINRATRTIRR